MSKPPWRPIASVVLFTALLAFSWAHGQGHAARPLQALRPHGTPSLGLNAGYPRLANYNGFATAGQVPFFAAYDLVIAQRGAPINLLKRANPHVITLLYERTLQVDLCCSGALYGLTARQIPPGWWLLGAGTRLTLSIGRDQDWIPVDDGRLFSPCEDIQVDGESMHVWGVEGNWLHVLRGYESTAAPHGKGARVAPHVSYRSDLSNCHITGPRAASSLRPWSLNLSSYCPRWHGMSWVDFLARRIASLVRRGGWSGVFYDNLNDLPFSPLIDTNNDGRADGGIVRGKNVWRDGERRLLAETRALLPGRPVLVNGNLDITGLADGREMEGFPIIPGLPLSAAIDSYLADGTAGLPMTIVNPDTVDRPTPDPAAAELGLGIALLGSGYATYDRGWIEHGAMWWFDPYDGGAGTALRESIGPWTARVPVAHPWRFQVGDTVLMDQEAATVAAASPHTLTLERGMDGTVAAAHPVGTSVTTAWQRMKGHGYLGLPLGPAHIVATAPWQHYALPLDLIRHPDTGATSLQHAAIHVLSAATQFAVRSGLSYNPDAAGVDLLPPAVGPVLRTLVFSARGPAGQAIWVGAGGSNMPLTLRSTWHRYVLPFANVRQIKIGTGRVGGAVQLRGLQLYGIQAYVWRRDFTHGIVLVNPTDRIQLVTLERPYRLLASDQDPQAGASKPTCTALIDHYHAAILLRVTDPHARCPARPRHARRTSRGRAEHR